MGASFHPSSCPAPVDGALPRPWRRYQPTEPHAPHPQPHPPRGLISHGGSPPSKCNPREHSGNILSKTEIAQKIKLRRDMQLPGEQHPSCRTGNAWSALAWQRTPRRAAAGGLKGTTAHWYRGTQTTSLRLKKKLGLEISASCSQTCLMSGGPEPTPCPPAQQSPGKRQGSQAPAKCHGCRTKRCS